MFSGFFNNIVRDSGIILVGGIIAFFIAIRLLKQWLRKTEQRDQRGGDFDMADLFDLYQQGKLTAEEYERAKHAVLARQGRSASPSAEPDTRRGFAVIPAGQQSAPPSRSPTDLERQ